jgi:hypothetical protein
MKVARRFLTVEEYQILEGHPVINARLSKYFEDKNIPRSFLPRQMKMPDGSTVRKYCYIFECVPGLGGKHPQPSIDPVGKAKIWDAIGAPGVPVESVPCRCYKWPELARMYLAIFIRNSSLGSSGPFVSSRLV